MAQDKTRRIAPEIAHRRARHEYEILETIEAGIELLGSEVKSLRAGGGRLDGSFALINDMEARTQGLYIAPYAYSASEPHDPTRPRKLLLHRREIARLAERLKLERLTLVPLRLYWVRGKAKLELALCRGMARADKREAMKRRDQQRDIDQALRQRP